VNFWKNPHPLTLDFSKPARPPEKQLIKDLWREAYGLYRIRLARGQAHQQITVEIFAAIVNSPVRAGKRFATRLAQALTLCAVAEWPLAKIEGRQPGLRSGINMHEPIWWADVRRRDTRAYDYLFARLRGACEPMRTCAPGPKSQDAQERSTPHAESEG
jgi:sugar (pentulose or hexulose) kinase